LSRPDDLVLNLTMPLEIERKFRITSDAWRPLVTGSQAMSQGYLANTDQADIRVRCAGARAFLTIKGHGDLVREEFEYEIPVAHGLHMLETLCERRVIHKTRHHIRIGDILWEVDEFGGAHQGLVLAEVELSDADQVVDIPAWIGEEVTRDRRFRNSDLARAAAASVADVEQSCSER
jgi:CYTH domain-containing protein